MEKNILSGNVEELKRIERELVHLNNLELEIQRMQIGKRQLERDIEAEERLISDNIERTINRRRDELTQTFDQEIEKDQNRLKTIRSDRGRAKSKEMQDRIVQETDTLSMENRTIHEEIRTIFKQKRISRLCDTKLFFSLYYPKGFAERFLAFVLGVLTLLGIPCFLYWFLEYPVWAKFIICAVMAVAFIGMYIGIYRLTKLRYHDTFKDMRKLRNKIDKNRRMINKIKKSIQKDRNEEIYNLEEFDQELKVIEDRIRHQAERKSQALADFEINTRKVVTQEIIKKDESRIRQLKEKAAAMAQNLLRMERENKEKKADLVAEYGTYVGTEFMSAEKTRALIILMEEGSAVSIGQARDLYKRQP